MSSAERLSVAGEEGANFVVKELLEALGLIITDVHNHYHSLHHPLDTAEGGRWIDGIWLTAICSGCGYCMNRFWAPTKKDRQELVRILAHYPYGRYSLPSMPCPVDSCGDILEFSVSIDDLPTE